MLVWVDNSPTADSMDDRFLQSPVQSPETDSDLKIKKTRASKPKVKTGCQTCKIRRVKCDETKPSCMRCVRFGHKCDGYTNKPPVKPQPNKGSRVLVPKDKSPLSPSGSSTSDSPTLSPSPSHPPKLYPSPTRMLFQTPYEYQAFQTFCSRTSHQLSSSLTADLWTRLMLQACENSPSIRHAVIAIGTLDLTSTSPWPENTVGTLRHQHAFRQYSKALCLLRRDVAGGFCDLRTTLIACLLFYCFESYHGYHELAINQVYSGLRLIREWTTTFYKPSEGNSSQSHSHSHSHSHSSGSHKSRPRISSDHPPAVEDDILRAFAALEIQVMTYADGRTREAHEQYRHFGQEHIDEMPSVFRDLEQARRILELVIRRSMHWLRSTMHLHHFSTPGDEREREQGSGSLFFDVDPTFEERVGTLKEYERWDSAFRPLLNHSRSRSASQRDFLLASTLRLHWLAGYLSIASNNSHASLVNNSRFTTELEELVGIARILLAQEDDMKTGGEVFDMQIIVPLMTVGWVYRHRALRKQAIELLLRSPRKEGVCDGIVVGKIMKWLADVEEEYLDLEGDEEGKEDGKGATPNSQSDYVPEWAAARCIRMSFDEARREASVSCLQPVKGSLNGEERRRDIVIPW